MDAALDPERSARLDRAIRTRGHGDPGPRGDIDVTRARGSKALRSDSLVWIVQRGHTSATEVLHDGERVCLAAPVVDPEALPEADANLTTAVLPARHTKGRRKLRAECVQCRVASEARPA